MLLQVFQLFKKAAARLDVGQNVFLHSLCLQGFWEPHLQLLWGTHNHPVVVAQDKVTRLHGDRAHLNFHLRPSWFFGGSGVGMLTAMVDGKRHLPQQGRVPAVAVDHQASEASAPGLAGQQLPEEAARTGPMGVTWFPSHASVDHDDLSGPRLAQRGQNSQEVTVHRNGPRHAHHAVTWLQRADRGNHASFLVAGIAQSTCVHRFQLCHDVAGSTLGGQAGLPMA
mmetsp:Transcript_39563/g.85453  ORF Transcript_39563/g.85453 Transcript_39563/m.85453 type:complete len:225 (-) Transcript_39563:95-769(-)